jgi:threonine aldolase
MRFASDNWAGVPPRIAEALMAHSGGQASAYGTSDLDRKIEATFNEIFECEVGVFFVGTGTAANSLALAACGKAGGVALCHDEAHVAEDEGGAPQFLSSGNRLRRMPGRFGKIDPEGLEPAFEKFRLRGVHHGRPVAVTISQATEIGTVYSVDEIAQIAKISHGEGLPVHMDGARFANALVTLGVSPAEMTWKAGVDIVSFGGTKNGCWCAEALLCFKPELVEDFAYLRKRTGHLFSKSRFIAAQFEAYFRDGLWLDLARHANSMAQELAGVVENSANSRLAWPVQANQVYAVMNRERAAAMLEAGAAFHEWPRPAAHRDVTEKGEGLYRLVTNFSTESAEIEAFAALLNR